MTEKIEFPEFPTDQPALGLGETIKDSPPPITLPKQPPAPITPSHQSEPDEQQQLWVTPEAPCVVYTTLFFKEGGWCNFTLRGADPFKTLDDLIYAIEYAKNTYGASTVKQDPAPQPAYPGAAVPAPAIMPPTIPQAFPPMTSAQAAMPPQPPAAQRDDSHGTDVLNKLVVQPGGKKIDFYVGKFKWPFTNSFGAASVATLFDPELGVTPEWLSNPMEWEPLVQSKVQLYVDWVAVTKQKKNGAPGETVTYRNVVRVHK